MLKVSYRILDPEKNKDLIRNSIPPDALIYFPGGKERPAPAPRPARHCVEKKLGLIGFHVGHKTRFAPQWVWTSFEHVSNVPDYRGHRRQTLLPRYSFFNAKCSKRLPEKRNPAAALGSADVVAIPDQVPEPGGPRQHGSGSGPRRSRQPQQVVPRHSQGHGLGKLHAARPRNGRAISPARPIPTARPRRPISPIRRSRPSARARSPSHHRAAWPAMATP